MNIRQQKYKANRLAGMNQYNAARAAGYSESMSRTHNDRLERAMKGDIVNALEQAGITDKYQAEALKRLTVLADFPTQISTLKHIADLKGQSKARVEHTGKVGGGTTVNVFPNKTIVFAGINESDDDTADRKDIYATQGEDSPRVGETLSSP